MKEIVQNGHPVLRDIAQPVSQDLLDSDELKQHIDDMYAALYTQDDGVALAAPQIGLSQRIFIVSEKIRDGKNLPEDTPLVYINPSITKSSNDKKKMDEGCLSVRPLYGTVRRASRIEVEAYTVKGEKFTHVGSGLLAQIYQHEIEHLDGVLFIDHAEDIRELSDE